MLKIANADQYVLDLDPGHRFPMEKYDLLPKQLLHEGTVLPENFFVPQFPKDSLFKSTHCEDYLNALNNGTISPREQRQIGFPYSKELIQREKMIMEGTRMAAEYALIHKVSMNIAGGTHHAFSNKGEGFCMLNDQAIAANWLLENQLTKRILIIDLDVHQGNGTAEIFSQNNDVFTFSMHGDHNYPLRKEKSDLDVGLPDAISGKSYLELLDSSLEKILNNFSPTFLFYQCGVDILETDKLGRLAVSRADCKERDVRIFKLAKELNTPIVCSMGGGYSPDIKEIIEAHANTFRVAQHLFF